MSLHANLWVCTTTHEFLRQFTTHLHSFTITHDTLIFFYNNLRHVYHLLRQFTIHSSLVMIAYDILTHKQLFYLISINLARFLNFLQFLDFSTSCNLRSTHVIPHLRNSNSSSHWVVILSSIVLNCHLFHFVRILICDLKHYLAIISIRNSRILYSAWDSAFSFAFIIFVTWIFCRIMIRNKVAKRKILTKTTQATK